MIKQKTVYKFFKFLEDKRGENPPLKYKVMYHPNTITEEDLKVEGDLLLNELPIAELPDNLTVKGNMILYKCKIKKLPNNLTVAGVLNISRTEIEEVPNKLKVGLNLNADFTPLSKKYTEKSIRKIIEKKGGYVKESIFLDKEYT